MTAHENNLRSATHLSGDNSALPNSPITESPEEVGQAGSDKSSDAAKSPNIDAGGDGPRRVN